MKVFENPQQREIHDYRDLGPSAHPCFFPCHLMLDDPSCRDTVSDAGEGKQPNKPWILPTIENHAGRERNVDLPRLAMPATGQGRVVEAERDCQENEKFPGIEKHTAVRPDCPGLSDFRTLLFQLPADQAFPFRPPSPRTRIPSPVAVAWLGTFWVTVVHAPMTAWWLMWTPLRRMQWAPMKA